MSKTSTKQVIVVRADLKMRRGKEAAQVAHASMSFMTRKLFDASHITGEATHVLRLNYEERSWLEDSFTKIVVSVNSEEELFEIRDKALEKGVTCHVIQDNGFTEFDGVPTYTCLALGPDRSYKLDRITGDLKLR